MADRARRARRARGLRSLFPAVYDTRPRGSALGELLDALAGGLTDLDEAIEQVVRNRWVRLAREDAPAPHDAAGPQGAGAKLAAQRACLDQLGRLVGVVPLADEPLELFRQRIVAQARVLRGGLTTPRAVLELAATAMGLELCGRLDRPPPTDGSRLTIGHGVRPGTLARCGRTGPACGRARACPHQDARAAQLLLIDNPPDLRTRVLPGVAPGDQLALTSESVEDAQPVLRLRVPDGDPAVAWPVLQHGEETLFYAGTLQPGETLVVTPVRADDDRSGTAVLLVEQHAPRTLGRDALVYFTTSARFADDPQPGGAELRAPGEPDAGAPARFAADDPGPGDVVTRFARFGETVLRTPLLPAGGTRWTVGQLGRKQLVDMLGSAEVARRFPGALDVVEPARFTLELEWTVYPAATFQLRIPRNPAVREAEAHGAIGLIQELVELARAAGVAAWVDFPQEQALRDDGPAGDDHAWQAALTRAIVEPHPAAVTLALAAAAAFAEHPSQDDALRVDNEVAYPLFAGIFAADDMAVGTRFNTSHFPRQDARCTPPSPWQEP